MILTRSFVVLSFPRTGSTYVRTVMRRLFLRAWNPWGLRNRFPWAPPHLVEVMHPIDRTWKARRLGRRSQHGRWGQIPDSHRHLPVVSVMRHPLDHAVSRFMHVDWRQHPPTHPTMLKRRFARWPQLSFDEFLEFEREFVLPDILMGVCPPAEIGCHTAHFLRFYAREPDHTLVTLSDDRIDSGDIVAALPPIRWLRYSRLAEDLCDFLAEMGVPRRRLAWVREHPPVNVSRERGGRHWKEFFTPDAERLQRRQERLLFHLFPDLEL